MGCPKLFAKSRASCDHAYGTGGTELEGTSSRIIFYPESRNGGLTFGARGLELNLTCSDQDRAEEGNHSIGYKQETLKYDKKLGILLQDAYRGTHSFETDEYGWNETDPYISNAVDSNIRSSAGVRSANLVGASFFLSGLAAAGLITLATILYRRRKPHRFDSSLQITC